MPLPPPANLSEWEREDYRLWLGSEGWYGLEKVKEYKALLAAHRANAPMMPGRKTAEEEREIARLQASDDIGLDIAYYSALQCFALWSSSLVEWIDTQAPQGVRNLILLGAARLYENMRRHFADTKKKLIRVPPSGGGRVPGVKPLRVGRVPGVLERLGAFVAPGATVEALARRTEELWKEAESLKR